jgi:hypothetical protein
MADRQATSAALPAAQEQRAQQRAQQQRQRRRNRGAINGPDAAQTRVLERIAGGIRRFLVRAR